MVNNRLVLDYCQTLVVTVRFLLLHRENIRSVMAVGGGVTVISAETETQNDVSDDVIIFWLCLRHVPCTALNLSRYDLITYMYNICSIFKAIPFHAGRVFN